MLPYSCNPENNRGKIWWDEKNPKMREKWRTQEEYDKFKENGGTRLEYVEYSKSIKKLQKKNCDFFNRNHIFLF